MCKICYLTLIIAATLFLGEKSESQICAGSISGVVLQQTGVPLSGAEVDAQATGAPKSKPIRLALADERGHFEFKPVKCGEYKLYAMLPAAGYPDTKFETYSSQYHPIEVSVSQISPSPDVSILVGPRSGILKLDVIEAANHAKIENPVVELRRIDSDVWVSSTVPTTSEILLPPDVAIQITLRADGFETWSRGNPHDRSTGNPITLRSQEQKLETVEMKRITKEVVGSLREGHSR